MTDRRKDNQPRPELEKDWDETETLAGQEWRAPAAPQAVAGKGEVPELTDEQIIDAVSGIYLSDFDDQSHGYDIAIARAAIKADRASLSSPAERQEAEAEKVSCPECSGTGGTMMAGDCSDCNGKGFNWEPIEAASPASAEPVQVPGDKLVPPDNLPRWIDNLKGLDPTIDALIEYIIKLAAPSSPSVSGTVDTPEFREICRMVWGGKYDAIAPSLKPLIAHIEQYTAQAVRAAREEANDLRASLVEVTDVLDAFGNLPDGMMHPEPWNMRKAEEKIRRAREVLKRTPQAAETEQEKKQ